jgi:AcrR family transcriptional regulator
MPKEFIDFSGAPGGHELLDGVEPASARRLAHAALASFSSVGYGGTTTRIISEQAGLSSGALYSSFKSKEEILFLCTRLSHESALGVLRAAAAVEGSAMNRLRRMMYDFTLWHARNHAIARVAQYELAGLTPEHHEVIAELRRQIESVMRAQIQLGVDQGEFDIEDQGGLTLAALSLAIDVCRWYNDGGRLTAERLADSYSGLVTRMLSSSNGPAHAEAAEAGFEAAASHL